MATTEALAFDMYGTLIDPARMSEQLERLFPEDGQALAQMWRQRQLEFTFRLAAMERYEDFAQVTRKALDYTLEARSYTLDAAQKDALLAQYDRLEPFDDVKPGLERLKQAGHMLAVFSNGTPKMLDALVENAGLRGYFKEIISVDAVQTYKPAPRTYRHVASRLMRAIGETRLISSNPFDIVGAEAIGMQTAWINRSGAIFDPLGPRPALIVGTLTELADRLAGA